MRWAIPTRDVHGRRRELLVVVSEGEVVILPPPGEGFIVPATSDAHLGEAIRDARRVARQMRRRSS